MNEDGPHTLDISARMQADHLSLAAKDLLPALLAVTPATPQAKEALTLLQNWDGVMDKDRAEPLIFEAWLSEMHRLLLAAKTGDPLGEKGPFAAAAMEFILANRAGEWCGKDDADCAKLKAEALNQALAMVSKRQGPDMNNWRWGRENVALLRHKFYSRIPLLDRLSDLSVESSGDFYTLDREAAPITMPIILLPAPTARAIAASTTLPIRTPRGSSSPRASRAISSRATMET